MAIEYAKVKRVFDVILRQVPYYDTMPLKVTVVANSFLQASAAAVDRANEILDEIKADDYEPRPKVAAGPFMPADVVSMEVVRDFVSIFKH